MGRKLDKMMRSPQEIEMTWGTLQIHKIGEGHKLGSDCFELTFTPGDCPETFLVQCQVEGMRTWGLECQSPLEASRDL